MDELFITFWFLCFSIVGRLQSKNRRVSVSLKLICPRTRCHKNSVKAGGAAVAADCRLLVSCHRGYKLWTHRELCFPVVVCLSYYFIEPSCYFIWDAAESFILAACQEKKKFMHWDLMSKALPWRGCQRLNRLLSWAAGGLLSRWGEGCKTKQSLILL